MYAAADAHGVREVYYYCISLHMLVNITACVRYIDTIFTFPLFLYVYIYTFTYMHIFIYIYICIHMHT